VRTLIVVVVLAAVISGLCLFGCGGRQVVAPEVERRGPGAAREPGEERAAPAEGPKDIVDTAVAEGSFETLVRAVGAADLVATLKGEGPFTLFAPTDEAFAKLPAGTVDDLLKPENKDRLTAILTYHVVAGTHMAADVTKMASAETVNGQELTFKVEGDTVMVDGAKVVQTDIQCTNGVIHVIDAVMIPE